MAIDSAHALLRSLRPVRRVDDTSAPWTGEVVRDPSGDACLLVDVNELGEGWAGWRIADSEHLLAPRDIVRTPSGHAALFPLCAERLIDVVRRRADDRDPLSAGEALTVAVSVLRGHLDAETVSGSAEGSWWLTDDGRPVLALRSTGVSESAEILRLLAARFPSWGEVFGDVLAALGRERLSDRDAGSLEERMFALAQPQPLRIRATRGSPAMRDADPGVSARPVATRMGTRAAARAAAGEAPGQGLLRRISTLMDRDLGDAVSKATTGVWRAARERGPRSRRRGLVIAAGASAVVLAIGLSWPSDTEPPSAAEPVATVSQTAPSAPLPQPSDAASTAPAAAAAATDLVALTDGLLTSRAACGSDPQCLESVMADPVRALPPGPSDLPSSARTVTFLDDLGGAAVLRVDGHATAEAASQLVIIVKIGERWLIRDIHDAGATP